MKASAQIFLSYAREDKEKVEALYQKLSDAEFKPWMDEKDILPGERWESCVQRAIQDSDFFLACLSTNSVNKRGFLQKEIRAALSIWQEKLDSDIYLIPVRLDDCEVPESLRDLQWVDLFEEDGWTRLVEAIQVGMERRDEEFLANEYGYIVSGEVTQKQNVLKRGQASLFWQEGQDQWSKGELTEAIISLDRAVTLFEEIGESEQADRVCKDLAQVYVERGSRKERERQLVDAEENYRRARSIYRRTNDVGKGSEILYKLGQLLRQREKPRDAQRHLEGSFGIWRDLPEDKRDLDFMATVEESLAELLPPWEAVQHLCEALIIRTQQVKLEEAERLWQQVGQQIQQMKRH